MSPRSQQLQNDKLEWAIQALSDLYTHGVKVEPSTVDDLIERPNTWDMGGNG